VKQPNKKPSKKKPIAANGWAALTWEDLNVWAGNRTVTRGRAYERQDRVKDLAISEDGQLLATVQGGERYVVSVKLNAGKKKFDKISSHCTCPVGINCKHAVATIAAYLQELADGATVPTAETDDPRWGKLSDSDADNEDDWDDYQEEDEGDEEDEEDEPESRQPKYREPMRRKSSEWDEKIQGHIRGKNREELAEQVLSLVARYPELREEYRERIALSEGDVDRLVAQARRELRERTSEMGWQNHWQGEGHTPDYDRLKHRLERLVELGHSNAVVELGREFIKRANDQIGQSHDEGETAMAAAECLPVVFDAVVKSTLSASQKILFAIDACLNDDYDTIDDSVGVILDTKWKSSDWSAVADELSRRLQKTAKTADDAWNRNYKRDRLSDWLLTALENAERKGEMLPIYENEARMTGSYERLVRYLIAEKNYEDAECWAKEGIEKTREKLPGIASTLAALLAEMSRGKKQWNLVAAHAACKFFEHPHAKVFEELVALAVKAKCGAQVRAAALRFLETGEEPFQWIASQKTGQSLRVDSAWPLPVPDYLVPLVRPKNGRPIAPRRPHFDVLLDMAIAAKRPEDILHWYDKMPKEQRNPGGGWGWSGRGENADRVAAAVEKSHPERALEIYQRGLEGLLPQPNPSAYESAGEYLEKMRPILKSLGRETDWTKLLEDIRLKYRNRPLFMEVLHNLEGHTILQTHKARNQRK
jgi:uncharacterized Zn finger protein